MNLMDEFKQAIADRDRRIAVLEAENEWQKAAKNSLASRLTECQAENEHWRKHGPILIKIIEELVDEGVDLGTIGEGTKLRIDGYITAARRGSDGVVKV